MWGICEFFSKKVLNFRKTQPCHTDPERSEWGSIHEFCGKCLEFVDSSPATQAQNDESILFYKITLHFYAIMPQKFTKA